MSTKERDEETCPVKWTSEEAGDLDNSLYTEGDQYEPATGGLDFSEMKRLLGEVHCWNWKRNYSSGFFSASSQVVAAECFKCGKIITVNEE